jgi:hypothetical protein
VIKKISFIDNIRTILMLSQHVYIYVCVCVCMYTYTCVCMLKILRISLLSIIKDRLSSYMSCAILSKHGAII